ncbi:hypothetical protein BDZ85DRAFT_12152 [Elsinoe ampelina]|uniref:BTB domain-containing protein n=1 Tax=Elsinoe ampelina TaxID=302913 RepID=A0A6A6GQU6_9PEZI|nr:hypothetical protein BDZ85DRAFT_12152 [Elsinoe ampelina]
METIVLYEGGDVIILPGESPTKQYQVQSHCLANASVVFKAMLFGEFCEGGPRSSSSPMKICLKHDDAKATGILLAVVHYKQSEDPPFHDAEEAYHLAQLCDKYNCIVPLGPLMSHWVASFIGSVQTMEFEHICMLIAVAEWMRNLKAYTSLTQHLIMSRNVSLTDLLTLGARIMSELTLVHLCARREEARSEIRKAIAVLASDTGVCSCRCSLSAEAIMIHITSLEHSSADSVANCVRSLVQALSFRDFTVCASRHNASPSVLMEEKKQVVLRRLRPEAEYFQGLALGQ